VQDLEPVRAGAASAPYPHGVPFVVLTGATNGIGRAAAIELVRRGAAVAIVGRDPAKVRATALAAGGEVHEYVADLERMDDVRRLAGELLERHPRIDVLANNAGAMFRSRELTADGFERTLALNHLAPFLLTGLLLPRLRESAARVVTTSSDAHGGAALDFGDLQSEHGFKPMGTYGTTKLCNILFTRELARRERAIAATCFHPGLVRTGFGSKLGPLWQLTLTVARPFMRSPARGARSLVWLALSDEAAGLTGVYVQDEKVRAPSPAARDDMLAAELWRRSEELVAAAR
jgi:NAD(P)-dependent dehydrogenase (short-subunit alcohol dehydrogenase family)